MSRKSTLRISFFSSTSAGKPSWSEPRSSGLFPSLRVDVSTMGAPMSLSPLTSCGDTLVEYDMARRIGGGEKVGGDGRGCTLRALYLNQSSDGRGRPIGVPGLEPGDLTSRMKHMCGEGGVAQDWPRSALLSSSRISRGQAECQPSRLRGGTSLPPGARLTVSIAGAWQLRGPKTAPAPHERC